MDLGRPTKHLQSWMSATSWVPALNSPRSGRRGLPRTASLARHRQPWCGPWRSRKSHTPRSRKKRRATSRSGGWPRSSDSVQPEHSAKCGQSRVSRWVPAVRVVGCATRLLRMRTGNPAGPGADFAISSTFPRLGLAFGVEAWQHLGVQGSLMRFMVGNANLAHLPRFAHVPPQQSNASLKLLKLLLRLCSFTT
jgi:hypothetical protein